VPMTAAVKVGGERLYRRAHRGEEVETPTREVVVHRAELVASDRDRAEFEIECSSGTYVRTLIETLGDAYCERLRRTAIGELRVADARDEPIPVAEALAFLPERRLSGDEAGAVMHGRAVAAGGGEAAVAEGEPARLTRDGGVIAVARRRGEELRPEVVLG
jgi:tRNA pseudouridine55 synthase